MATMVAAWMAEKGRTVRSLCPPLDICALRNVDVLGRLKQRRRIRCENVDTKVFVLLWETDAIRDIMYCAIGILLLLLTDTMYCMSTVFPSHMIVRLSRSLF